MDTPSSFGLWLRQRRRALDLTQEALANYAHCSVSAIRKLEADERRPSRELAEALADCLQIPPAEKPAFLKAARLDVKTLNVERPNVPMFNVPMFNVTPLLGREHELANISRLLQRPECRMLTLIGPGGIGKTRLAQAAASAQPELFADGVYFVSLAPLTSPDLIASTIANASGLTFHGSATPQAQLLAYLRQKSLLLILDNFEHLLTINPPHLQSGIALLNDILTGAPQVKLLVTSRERLNLQGEWVVELQGLPIPPANRAKKLEQYSAVALFLYSARRLKADLELTEADRPAMIRICRLLAGIPLGLELAASWVRLLSAPEIAEELERSLDFLTSPMHGLPERHRSLRAVFEYSWNLLSPPEKQVMRRLAVFQEVFRREAAEQVAGASLPLLSALVDKSLVQRAGAGRYSLHEFVRQYAQAYLQQEPVEAEATQQRHSRYYLNWLRQQEIALKSARQSAVLAELSAEIDNIRAAWEWAPAHSMLAELQGAACCLGWFYDLKGWLLEGATIFRRAVELLSQTGQSDPAHPLALAYLLTQQGYFCFRSGESALAQALLERSLALLRPLDEPSLLADTLMCLGMTEWIIGRYPTAKSLLHESLALYKSSSNSWSRAFCLGQIGAVAYTEGDYPAAQDWLRQSLTVWRAVGDPRGLMFSLSFLGMVTLALQEYRQAQQLLNESLALASAISDRWGIATALSHLGLIALAQAEYEEARYFFQESLSLFEEIGERWGQARALNGLGEVALALGEGEEAQRCLMAGFKTASAAQTIPLILEALVGLAQLRIERREFEPALELLLYAGQHPSSSPETKARAERLQAEITPQLTPPQIETAQQRVQNSSFDELTAHLLK
ncbi:MAG: tetratricopeptide repeat protein [Anaerolineae bacterium]